MNSGARVAAGLLAASAFAACGAPAASTRPAAAVDDASHRLPTGAYLDPVSPSLQAGSLPLAIALSPDHRYAVLLLNGFDERGIEVIDRRAGRVTANAPLASAFLGLAFSPDGRTLAASGGNADAIYLFSWSAGVATLQDSVLLVAKRGPSGTRYPAGIAWSRDGRSLYAAEDLADSIAVIDVASKQVTQRFPVGRYPYGVAVAPNGNVYVSAWGGHAVAAFTAGPGGALAAAAPIPAGRHPSALLLNADGSRLFIASASTDRIAVVDTRARSVIAELHDPAPAGPGEGSTPNALALSAGGTRLFVAEADNNSVAAFDLSAATSGVTAAKGTDRLLGRFPVEWYPAGLAMAGDTVIVLNAKGHIPGPNAGDPTPRSPSGAATHVYTLSQLNGTVLEFAGAMGDSAAYAPLSARVARANGWDAPARSAAHYPPFEHVIYVLKENRTFDQVLSDVPGVDGDTSLQFFTKASSPNHHALAERFGAFDRFFVNAEVSADGHNWTFGSYAADYVEKTTSLNYSDQGRDYDYEGENRNAVPDDDVNEPANGYLWNAAARAKITFRDYGEFIYYDSTLSSAGRKGGWQGTKKVMRGHTSPDYPGFDLAIKDQHRIDVWLEEFKEFERTGVMPALMTMTLQNDHTSGLRAGAISPRAAFADNDLALGRLIEALSHSQFWKNTVVFVVEDDAQNGADHVDSHRSVMFAISAYSRPGAVHRFTNTTDVIATIVEILHLAPLSQFDFYGRPLRGIFLTEPDLSPYAALTPAQNLDEVNPALRAGAAHSRPLDLSGPDKANEDDFNRELWRAFKGANVPYPGARRMSLLEAAQAR